MSDRNLHRLLHIEVVAAFPTDQKLVELSMSPGVTAGEAIDASGLAKSFPELAVNPCEIAIWGQVVARNRALKDGDRVELLRPLKIDPREARRRLAAAGEVLSGAKSDQQR